MVFELLWRDFFRFMGLKVGDALFQREGPVPPKGQGAQAWRDPARDVDAAEALARWKAGKTGAPLVDANMRELQATGFMSNRGRQNVASYLVHDLNLDWRSGAAYFEEVLLDYDVCSNWGNWIAMAGLTGGRVNRFNILKQSRDYDPKGEYVHLWLPELKNVPAPQVFEPWKLSKAQQEASGVFVGTNYPAPLPRPGSSEAFFAAGKGAASGGGGKGGGGGGKGKKKESGGGRGYKTSHFVDSGKGGGGGGGGNGGRKARGSRVQSHYMGDFE